MQQDIYAQMNDLEGEHWWFCARRKYLDKLISLLYKEGPEAHQYCEIGAGTGGNLALLAKFAMIDVVEMNSDARDWIKEKNIDGVQTIHSGHLPDNVTLDKKYDAIFALDVIEHIDDDFNSLKRIKDFLKEDGCLVTTVPAYQWLWSPHDEIHHHKHRYTKTHYCNLLRQAGYEVTYSSYFNTLLFPLAAVNRVVNKVRSTLGFKEQTGAEMPGTMINTLFEKIFNIESLWAGKLSIPFGLSIVVVAQLRSET
jgi:SAM-dependent methyltransferase